MQQIDLTHRGNCQGILDHEVDQLLTGVLMILDIVVLKETERKE